MTAFPRLTWHRPVVRPADRWLVAATIAVNALGVAAELSGANRPVPTPLGGYLLGVLTGAVLLWRRQAPLATTLAVIAGCAVYHFLGYPGNAVGAALFGALYSVTAYGSGRRALAAAGGLILLASAVPLLPPHPALGNLWGVIGPALGMASMAAAGEAVRARRLITEEQLQRVRETADEQARRLIADERLMIARELHDVLAHTITVIGVQAAAGADAVDTRPAEAKAAFGTIRVTTKEALADLRSTVRLLRRSGDADPVAPQPRLSELPQLVEQATAAGVAARLEIAGDAGPVPIAIELAAYRIVQEALTNVVRHANARAAEVRVEYAAGALLIEVTDDGTAAPTAATPANGAGHGLIGMRERARAVGGVLEAGPGAPGAGGFRVWARLPTGVGA